MRRREDVAVGVEVLELVPGRPVRLPGTGVEVRWDGDQALAVYRRGGVWDLSPAIRPGRVLAWTRLVAKPQLGWWPLLPLGVQRTYRANSPFPVAAEDAGRLRHRRTGGNGGSWSTVRAVGRVSLRGPGGDARRRGS